MQDRPEAMRIIDRWIDTAHARGLREQFRAFWYIRDILEGLKVRPEIRAQVISTLRNCKASPERDAIINALGESL